MADTLGILLAGGRGRRLGGDGPKALVLLAGRTLLARALATLELLCDDVVVCAPGSLALPVEQARRVRDPEPGDGPLAGLVAGLASRPFARALALAVDLPFADAPMLAALGARLEGAPAAVPVPGGRPQPLAAWYAPAVLAPLAEALARGERALTSAVLALSPRLVPDAELERLPGGLDAFFNLNTPDDLALAQRRLALEGAR